MSKSEQLSAKGLTVCTPEFHAIAKLGREQAIIQSQVDEVVEKLDELAGSGLLTEKQRREIIRVIRYL